MWSRIPTTFAGARTGHTATRHGSFAVIVGGYDVRSEASELDATVFDLEAMRDAKIDADGCGFENRAGHAAASGNEARRLQVALTLLRAGPFWPTFSHLHAAGKLVCLLRVQSL